MGLFVVEFNRIDNLVSKLLGYAFNELERPELEKKYVDRNFAAKLDALELLNLTKASAPSRELVTELRAISLTRNDLVHAHFDQNPFDGSYDLIPQKGNKELKFDAQGIGQWAERAANACWKLRHVEAQYMFEEVDEEGSPHREKP